MMNKQQQERLNRLNKRRRPTWTTKTGRVQDVRTDDGVGLVGLIKILAQLSSDEILDWVFNIIKENPNTDLAKIIKDEIRKDLENIKYLLRIDKSKEIIYKELIDYFYKILERLFEFYENNLFKNSQKYSQFFGTLELIGLTTNDDTRPQRPIRSNIISTTNPLDTDKHFTFLDYRMKKSGKLPYKLLRGDHFYEPRQAGGGLLREEKAFILYLGKLGRIAPSVTRTSVFILLDD